MLGRERGDGERERESLCKRESMEQKLLLVKCAFNKHTDFSSSYVHEYLDYVICL